MHAINIFETLFVVQLIQSAVSTSEENYCNVSMAELDDRIIKNILHPVKGQGNELIKNLFQYYDILDDAKNLVDDGLPEGQKILSEIGPGGPKWVKVKYNEDLLRYTYNWITRDMTHFVGTIDATVELWESLSQNKTLVESD